MKAIILIIAICFMFTACEDKNQLEREMLMNEMIKSYEVENKLLRKDNKLLKKQVLLQRQLIEKLAEAINQNNSMEFLKESSFGL